MRKFVIEREIDGVGKLNETELCGAATTSNDALAKLAPRVRWVKSYVTDNRTFCICLAEDESVIREHAKLRGFPATRVFEVTTMIDPSSAGQEKVAKLA